MNKDILIRTNNVNNRIKKNTLVSIACLATSASLFFPAFILKGTLVDQVQFCFQPKEVHDPYVYKESVNKSFALDKKGKVIKDKKGNKKIIERKKKIIIGKRFCNEKNTRLGISRLVVEEMQNSLNFRSKVKITKKIKATNSKAGIVGLLSGSILGLGSLIYWSATKQLGDNQDILIHKKRSQMLTDALNAESELEREAYASRLDTEYIKEGLVEMKKYEYYGDDPTPDPKIIEKRDKEIKKQELLRDTSIELELSEMKAKIAESKKKEAESIKETEKINGNIRIKDSNKIDSKNNTDSTNKEDLINKLKGHEDGWLWTIINSIKPIWVTGDQGSGKSTFAVCIALCRKYLCEAKLVSIIDPEYNKNNKTSWKYLAFLEPRVYGEIFDLKSELKSEWLDVNQGLLDSMERWRVEQPESDLKCSIIDEITQYASQKETKSSAAAIMPLLISRPRKANEGVILISHLISNNATGGSEGYASGIRAGSFILNLKTANDAIPLFKGSLEGYKDVEGNVIKNKEITVPSDWFNPKKIKEMFK